MMTETTWLAWVILLLAVAIFWLGYRIGHRKSRSSILNFKRHNDQLQQLLTEPEGRNEVVRFVVNETALSDFLQSAQKEVEEFKDLQVPADPGWIRRTADTIWKSVKIGGRKIGESVPKKLLNKANSLISGWS